MKYINIDTYNNSLTTTFNQYYKLDIPIRGEYRELRLINAQIPVGWFNIRSPYNVFYFKQDSTSRTSTITEGIYNIDELLTQLKTQVDAVLSSVTLTATYSSTTNKITLAISTGTITIDNINATNSVFNKVILGFTTDQQSGSSIIAPSCFNINHDLYIYLSLGNINTNFHSSIPSHFKIPISVNNGNIEFYNPLVNFQTIKLDNITNITNLDIKVFDRYGNIINNNGLHWSFTLQVM